MTGYWNDPCAARRETQDAGSTIKPSVVEAHTTHPQPIARLSTPNYPRDLKRCKQFSRDIPLVPHSPLFVPKYFSGRKSEVACSKRMYLTARRKLLLLPVRAMGVSTKLNTRTPPQTLLRCGMLLSLVAPAFRAHWHGVQQLRQYGRDN